MLYDQYFLRYDFLKIYLQKIRIEFFSIFFLLCRIIKGVNLCLLEHANTKKNVHEHGCSFLSILAHLAHLAQSIFSDFKYDK